MRELFKYIYIKKWGKIDKKVKWMECVYSFCIRGWPHLFYLILFACIHFCLYFLNASPKY